MKNSDNTLLSSVTHATDSTCTGCSAKIAAASHAPGTLNRFNSRHTSTALAAWSRMFTQ